MPGKGGDVRARLGEKKKRNKRGRIRRGKVAVDGFCEEKDIVRVVSRREKGIQYCYERKLARNPSLSGRV